MTNNINVGEVLCLMELLEKHSIEIPIIQRDYAQGRDENSGIRRDFLEALKNSVKGNVEIKLDFIYGEVVGEGEVFQPLDGQQRLTTLFLLHWYSVIKEPKENTDGTIGLLKKFSYETRLSARYFCHAIVESGLSLDSRKLSDTIKDQPWFILSWKQDPSINAMLNTLDDIHLIFDEVQDLHKILAIDKKIKFHYLDLHHLGLSDDLYIKMNARGKLLTPFENLKAQIQMEIKKRGWEQGVDASDRFDYKIDTIWTDFFWDKFKEKLDFSHIKFVSAIIMSQIALRTAMSADERHDIIRAINDDKDGKYPLIKHVDEDIFRYILKAYDRVCGSRALDLTIDNIPFWTHECNDGILVDALSEKNSSYTKKLLLFAQLEFLIRNQQFDRNAYITWMRVVRNLVCVFDVTIANSKRQDLVRDPSAFYRMAIVINTLADGCGNIHLFLSKFAANKVTAYRTRIAEEILKAKKILEDCDIAFYLFQLEDLSVFRGRISFVFLCIKEMQVADEDLEEKEALQLLYNILSNNLDDKTIIPDIFNRAMLTIEDEGKYKYYDYWQSNWYAIESDNKGKRKLISNIIDLYHYIHSDEEKRDKNNQRYLLKLIQKLTDRNFSDIISEFTPPDDLPDWQTKLIKEEGWLEQRKSPFFAFTNDNLRCFLLKSQKPTTIDGSTQVI